MVVVNVVVVIDRVYVSLERDLVTSGAIISQLWGSFDVRSRKERMELLLLVVLLLLLLLLQKIYKLLVVLWFDARMVLLKEVVDVVGSVVRVIVPKVAFSEDIVKTVFVIVIVIVVVGFVVDVVVVGVVVEVVVVVDIVFSWNV